MTISQTMYGAGIKRKTKEVFGLTWFLLIFHKIGQMISIPTAY